jgi:hypothetical protein
MSLDSPYCLMCSCSRTCQTHLRRGQDPEQVREQADTILDLLSLATGDLVTNTSCLANEKFCGFLLELSVGR